MRPAWKHLKPRDIITIGKQKYKITRIVDRDHIESKHKTYWVLDIEEVE